MIALQVADLVVIAARVLEIESSEALDRLDAEAAEEALADARPLMARVQSDPADAAAVLLHALLRHRPLSEGNEQVAVVAMAQFLTLNGFEVALDPPDQARAVLHQVTEGRLDAAGLASWLTPRLSPRIDALASCAHQRSLLGWLPGRRRRQREQKDRFHRFTDRARTVVVLAQDEAWRLGHNYIGTEHLLLGLICEEEGVAAKALQARGIGAAAVRDQVEQIIGRGEHTRTEAVPFTPRARRVLLECSLREAMRLGHNYVGTEHLLLGLLREGDGVAADVLTGLGAHHTTTRQQVIELLRDHDVRPGEQPQPPLPDLRDIDDQIAQVRRNRETALDADDPQSARTLRAEEKRLLEERRQRIGQWTAGADVIALVEETRELRAQVEHLRALLREYGIDPDNGPDQTAQAGQ